MFRRTQVLSGGRGSSGDYAPRFHENRARTDAQVGGGAARPSTCSFSAKRPATAARTAVPEDSRGNRPRPGGHVGGQVEHAGAGRGGGGCRRLAILAMPMTPPSAGAVTRLAGLLGGYRPDRVLVLSPHASRTACVLGDETRSCHDVIKMLHQAHPCPFDLQLSHNGQAGGRTQTGGVVGRRPCCGEQRLRLVPPVHQAAPGWMSICTDTPAAGPYPAARAVEHARGLGQSVVLNGANLALVGETTTDDRGTRRTLWGLEVASFPAAPGRRGRSLPTGLGALEIDQSGAQPRTVCS